MLLNLDILNRTYVLGKAKVGDEWEVCILAGTGFYSADGENRRMGDRTKHRTRHRYFRKAEIHLSEVRLSVNDRVVKHDSEG